MSKTSHGRSTVDVRCKPWRPLGGVLEFTATMSRPADGEYCNECVPGPRTVMVVARQLTCPQSKHRKRTS